MADIYNIPVPQFQPYTVPKFITDDAKTSQAVLSMPYIFSDAWRTPPPSSGFVGWLQQNAGMVYIGAGALLLLAVMRRRR